jgi:transcription antitermination factor NusG
VTYLEQSDQDQFFIITTDTRREPRERLFQQIKDTFGDIEIFAPVEKRMIRPRRKTSKREPIYIQRPLFLQYVAVRCLGAWARLKRLHGVWDILSSSDGVPHSVSRRRLNGMLEQQKERSWDGQLIEVLSGPLAGRQGTYVSGKIELSLLGRNVWASVDPYHIKLVQES